MEMWIGTDILEYYQTLSVKSKEANSFWPRNHTPWSSILCKISGQYEQRCLLQQHFSVRKLVTIWTGNNGMAWRNMEYCADKVNESELSPIFSEVLHWGTFDCENRDAENYG